MPEFDVEQYLQQLAASTSCEECKVLSPKLGKKDRYIFISYSHKDYKQVYADLAQLYAADIPFWYDEGLPAGKKWDDVVQKRITDPNCAGVIFYLSENLFLSRSIQTEIAIACGTEEQQRNYFCVNLTNDTPFEISRKTILSMSFNEAPDKMQAQLDWLTTLTHAFSDRITYLTYKKTNHVEELLKQIATVFEIDPDSDTYSFDGAIFRIGSGVIEFENGAVYDGAFSDGLFCGQGKLTYPNGNIYTGDWQASTRHGQGVMTYPDGTCYTGQWHAGKKHGQGVMAYANGNRYDGNWQDSKKHGQGTMSYANGNQYDGEWQTGMRHGQGTMSYANGNRYVGAWQAGMRHGQGTMSYASGTQYDGEWQAGMRHGQGTMSYANGNRYDGEWQAGMRHGQGAMIYSEGSSYVGQWANGKRNGLGTESNSDGETYTGEWLDNHRHGQGILTWPNGEKFVGRFDHDEFCELDPNYDDVIDDTVLFPFEDGSPVPSDDTVLSPFEDGSPAPSDEDVPLPSDPYPPFSFDADGLFPPDEED